MRAVLRLVAVALCLTAVAACEGRGPAEPSPSGVTFTISGQVLSAPGGAPVASARVEVVAGANAGQRATADGSGRYGLSGLQPGDVTIEAQAGGYAAQRSSLTLGGNQTIDFALAAMAPGGAGRVTLSGLVAVDLPGSAPGVPAALVEITAGANAGQHATTDASGRFTIGDLQPGPASVRASAAGFQARSLTVDLATDHTMTFRLPAQFTTRGRTIDATSQAGLGAVSVSGDDLAPTASTSSGDLMLVAMSDLGGPRPIVFNGPGIVARETLVRVPGPDATVSLIPQGFDLVAFDQMFRAPHLSRWTSAPPLRIESTTLQFVDVNMADGTATADTMTNAEYTALVADLTWALPRLTGGAFPAFLAQTRTTAAPGASVHLLNTGAITVVRLEGLTAATGALGYGRWQYLSDGTVVGGVVMLDRDFDRSGGPNARSLRAHELGHALGYSHVTARPSVMNVSASTEPTSFDLDAARIAFQRPPGNRSPDIDPSNASVNRAGGAGVWKGMK